MKHPKRKAWNPFRGNRTIARQNAKRARIHAKGLAITDDEAAALIADAIAAGHVKRIPARKRTRYDTQS